jgi:hypothetical protein
MKYNVFSLVEKYKKHRLPNGTKVVVPFYFDTGMTQYQSIADGLAIMNNASGENTPLLAATNVPEENHMHLSHPTTGHIAVPRHAGAENSSPENDADEIELGLQLQPMMLPSVAAPGKGTAGAFETHVEHHVHHENYGTVDTNDLGSDVDDLSDESLLKNVINQLNDIWNTVQLKSVWRPMVRS